MTALNSKYHIKIGDFGFLLAKGDRTNRHVYTREEAPAFVNKFSSGEPNYRDSTFFPHWVQLNFLNGFNQEFFDDGGKFYRSASVDTTEVQKLSLEKNFSSAGTVSSNYKINTQQAWRASQNWWNANYSYRKQITVTAPAATALAVGYPMVITEDTAALQTASKVQADRDDWRVVYFNGTTWTDLSRHYVSTTRTVFGIQTAIAAGATDNGYYIYYGNPSESTNKQPTTDAEWNSVYGMYGTTMDANTLALYHFQEGSGTTVTDTDGSSDLTSSGMTYNSTDTRYGFMGLFDNSDTAGYTDSSNTFNLGSMSIEALVKPVNTGSPNIIVIRRKGDDVTTNWDFFVDSTTLKFAIKDSGGTTRTANAATALNNGTVYWVAGTYDGSTIKVYVNGVLDGSASCSSVLTQTSDMRLYIGGKAVGGSDTYKGNIAHVRISNIERTSFGYVHAAEPTYTIGSEVSTQPLASTFTHMVGSEDGTVYSWDGISTYTALFNTRQLTWYETGTDADKIVGDVGGTETAQSQGFQVAATTKMKAVQVYLKKNAGTPGDITVRIETDHATPGKPSGTLVDATNATATIPAFTTSTYGWITVEFPASFTLAATTTYHLVLKTAAAANDQNYAWAADASSPSYTSGAMSVSTDGGSSWTAVSAADAYFRVLGATTSVNCSLISSVGGTQSIYFGTGNPAGTETGDARLYSYDGTNWELKKTFTSTNESCILSLAEFGTTTSSIYIGLGAKAKVYVTTDLTTFTLSKTITQPNSPGYVYTMKEYNGKLYVGGGFPEQLPGNAYQYSGFLYSYDEFAWNNVFPFDHTVVISLETFDSLLFIGTIKKRLYVFNTASIDKLFDFPWNLALNSMVKFDDKLAIATAPTPGQSTTSHEAVYLFDRSGFHNAFNASGKKWQSVFVFNNNLMGGSTDGVMYQTSSTTYIASGTLQTSYEEAQLPSIYKIRRDITLQYESLPTGTSISISYKSDESDSSWTSIGTADDALSTEETFNFASGVYTKKISFLVTLATSDPTVTPVLKKIIHKYVLSPDFKYRWNMTLVCADNIEWQDGTEPAAILGTTTTAGVTSITLSSTDQAVPTTGFPDPNGATYHASIINPDTGIPDRFTYTGKTDTTLTGIPATGTYALGVCAAGSQVKVLGRDIHQNILDLKQTRQLFTFTDVDGLTYTVLFNAYQSNNWIINQDEFYGGFENEVPISLLEA